MDLIPAKKKKSVKVSAAKEGYLNLDMIFIAIQWNALNSITE